MLEGGPTIPRSSEKVGISQTYVDDVGGLVVPISNTNLCEQVDAYTVADKSGLKNSHVENNGSKVIKTKKGVLFVDGPNLTNNNKSDGAVVAKGTIQEGKAHGSGLSKKQKIPKKALKPDGVSKLKHGNKKIIPNLPFNKASKIPKMFQNIPRQKRILKLVGGGNQGAFDAAGSDSIRNSDVSPSEQSDSANGRIGIELEVLLPSFPVPVDKTVSLAARASSGMDLILHADGEGRPKSRQVVEGEKLIDLAEEVGLKFHGRVGEDLARVVAMDERDCKEKEGWEMRRENAGFQ
ncbi:hypothetical protein TSUD_420490 [Trifolium subterraneum]|uniref:Uncharacterized protein n=1 Tax=Trifolium subterraneum TaxID=3900 RepID=A0A1B5Z8E3_TRISU|nr:hypothetical protein TSUD_420490 [Trifolium subterraneum]